MKISGTGQRASTQSDSGKGLYPKSRRPPRAAGRRPARQAARASANDNALTARQRAYVDFIREFHAHTGHAPSVSEIRDGLCLASNNAVAEQLARLAAKGVVSWTPRRARTLRVLPGVAR